MEQLTELFVILEKNQSLASAAAAMTSAAAAILALVISAAAVIATIVSTRQQRTHNILSVKPIPEVAVADFDDCLRVKLRNHGSGPLLIKALTVNFLGSSYDALIDCMPDNIAWANFAGIVNGRSLLPGNEITLVELIALQNEPNFSIPRDLVRNALSHSEIVVEYSDIYGSEFPAYGKSLDWFRRNLE